MICTIFLQIGSDFLYISLMVPLLFQIFHPVLKWYHSVKQFSSFSEMVPFLFVIFGTFL